MAGSLECRSGKTWALLLEDSNVSLGVYAPSLAPLRASVYLRSNDTRDSGYEMSVSYRWS